MLMLLAGCGGYVGPRAVHNPDPAVNIPQMRRAVEAGDASVMPQLIAHLNDDDPAVRLFAVESLRRLTGRPLVFDWADDDRLHRQRQIEQIEKTIADNQTPGDVSTPGEERP
jgi:hypothetical protein